MKDYNKKVMLKAFSDSVSYYSEHANLQKETAKRMALALEPWQYSIPPGPILEVGAGTGFFTKHLVQMFNREHIIISDASPEMVEFCRNSFGESGHIDFEIIDIEDYDWPEDHYSMITGNFVAQWLKDPSMALSKMANSLKPGGFMLMSFPGSESYPQWKKYCLELGLPFTVNPLPDVEQLVINLSTGPVKVDFYEDQSSEQFENLFSFFRHMKNTGTSTSFTGKKLTTKQLRLLNSYWLQQNGGKIVVHYHTAFIAVKKDL